MNGDTKLVGITLGELLKIENDNDKYFKESEDCFTLLTPKLPNMIYDIPKETIRNPANIVKWIIHLTQKTWVKPLHIKLFSCASMDYLAEKKYGL